MKIKTMMSIGCLLACIIVVMQPVKGQSVPAQLSSPPIYLKAEDADVDFFQPAPEQASQRMVLNLAPTATISVVYIPAGGKDTWGTSCLDFPAEARNAVNYAASVWANLLVSSVPIQVQACWASLGAGLLGAGGFNYNNSTFANNPFPNTLAPAALANTFSGKDNNGASPEIMITVNNDESYYFGTGSTPTGYYNLATVALHEIAHGLGFSGEIYVKTDNLGYKGDPVFNKLFAYDLFTTDGSYSLLKDYPNGSSSLAGALTSGSVYFTGDNAEAGNYGQPVPLYAPSSWSEGSSYTHLAQAFDGTANALMTYSLARQETNYDPGPITKGILADIGWKFAPSTIALSSNSVAENTTAGVTIGSFSTSGGNVPPTSTLTYSFTTGGVDNASFSIVGSTLRTNASLDFESKSAFSIAVLVSNGTTFNLTQNFSILVTDVNEAPVRVYAIPWVPPGSPAGSLVSTLFANDPDKNETFTFNITGGVDQSLFSIAGNGLFTTGGITRDLGQIYTIDVRATDHGGLSITSTLVFTVMEPRKVYLPGILR